MDKKYEDMSYEEVHELLAEAVQDAFTDDAAGPYQSPEIDYSFMDEEPVTKHKTIIRMSRFSKIAAIVIIVLLGMNVVLLATGSGESYSEKGLLHRIYEGARGIFTDEDESQYVEIDETGKTYTITDVNQLDEAKEIWPDLYVPEYIPFGFTLEKLKIQKEVSGDYSAEYQFICGDNDILLFITCVADNGKFKSSSSGQIIELTDRIINVYWDVAYEKYVCDVYFDGIVVNISGNIEEKEIIKIAENLRK